MARIMVKDIPLEIKISREELKRIRGGTVALLSPTVDVEDPINVMFNPEKVTINKTVPWKDQSKDQTTEYEPDWPGR